jgi:hypothetical protein
VEDSHLLSFASFLAHSAVGQSRRIPDVRAWSGYLSIAEDLVRRDELTLNKAIADLPRAIIAEAARQA